MAGSVPPSTPVSRLRDLTKAGWHRVRTDAFGAEPTGARLERIRRSPNFVDGAFRNPVPTRRLVYERSPLEITRAQLAAGRERRLPAGPIPVHRLGSAELAAQPASGLRLTWLGHATVLAELDGRRVLFDPVWGVRCSPFPGIGPKRLHPMPIRIADLGPVDVVVISHDHYDHLDMTSIRALIGSGAQFAAPLGVGAHLEHWGVPAERITELDWWEEAEVAGLTLTATPARHYCSRGPRTSSHYLWASWAVAGPEHRVFHSGDTGYFPGFAETGRRLGPFDATMVQVGAYSPFWPEVHMTPEEGVRAHLDVGGELLLPIHWATFNLAQHDWAEPVERTLAEAERLGARVAVPLIGQPFEPASAPAPDHWWRTVAGVPTAVPVAVPEAVLPAAGDEVPA
ncbi:MBL fold metallo-hydrolase [Kitasatospora viridis]|uniref:L-ascorbate metabolism protein UlaG (Beta-lactamase superfamily) n=1 Tax=Kitasatospora viridis TaxID=281105 RepID=A0A561UAS9_9ACTN|nr:MBL fold metallo-hydrolase [Kitasatospora viridis]TWF96472.1 L-ascorbate metabolism protein UlaG (beta-lactamase superfamily) [Kitasatospora viridis]